MINQNFMVLARISVCICRHLGSQLAEMENVIEKMMEADLVEYAVQDIRHRLEACRDLTLAETETSESEVHM